MCSAEALLAQQMRFFEERFGIPFPPLPVAPGEIVVVPATALLLGTQITADYPCTATSDIRYFLGEAPLGYFLVGFEDCGISSFDFHYAYVDSWRRVWLRLNYSGAYADDDRAAARIRAFLPAYLAFERSLAGKVARLVVLECGTRPLYRVELDGGVVRDARDSMVGDPRFDDLLEQLLL